MPLTAWQTFTHPMLFHLPPRVSYFHYSRSRNFRRRPYIKYREAENSPAIISESSERDKKEFNLIFITSLVIVGDSGKDLGILPGEREREREGGGREQAQ